MHVKSASFSTDNSRTSRLSIFYRISNHKIFILKYLGKTCLWRRSLCSNLGGIGLEKLYRATLSVLELYQGRSNINTNCGPLHRVFALLTFLSKVMMEKTFSLIITEFDTTSRSKLRMKPLDY